MSTENEKHLRAYEQLLNQARDFITEAKQEFAPKIDVALEMAKERVFELGEMSREELDNISNYLRRDIYDAANFLAGDRGELSKWLRFDVEQVERRILESLSLLADPTKVELADLEERARLFGEWHTGEITGPGTLVCEACGEQLHFHETGHIPPCPKCKGSKFHRGQ